MTPLMNSVFNNHYEQFIYFYFKENCDIKNYDLQGNTLLHLAAKSNSINIAKILKHLFLDILQSGEDPNLSMEKSPEKGADGLNLSNSKKT